MTAKKEVRPAAERLAELRAELLGLEALIREDEQVIDDSYMRLAVYETNLFVPGKSGHKARVRLGESMQARAFLLELVPRLERLAEQEALDAPPEPLSAAELEAERQRVARIEREFQAAKPAHDRAAARMRGLAVPSNRRAPAVYDADPELTPDEILFTEERKRELRASGVL